MDPKCSLWTKKYRTTVEKLLKKKPYDYVYVNALLCKPVLGKQSAALFVQVPLQPGQTNTSARPRAVERYGEWNLPGTECLTTDANVLERLANEVYATL